MCLEVARVHHGLVVGQPNVGKTLLCLRLAQASSNLVPLIIHESPSGGIVERRLHLKDAISTLVSAKPHTTVGIQTLALGFGVKVSERFLLDDTTGLTPDIEDQMVRSGMARTLERIVCATVILHVVDASAGLARNQLNRTDELIRSVSMATKVPYFLIFNKLDLAGAPEKAVSYRKRHRETKIFSISALKDIGIEDLLDNLRRASVVK